MIPGYSVVCGILHVFNFGYRYTVLS